MSEVFNTISVSVVVWDGTETKDTSKNNDKMFEGHSGIKVFSSPFTFFGCTITASSQPRDMV